MYQIGEIIIYGSNGACRVEKVGSVEMDGLPKGKTYYTLKPVYANGGTVFTPVDNQKVVMRPIISREEAEDLIEHIESVETLWVEDEKKRELQYKEAMKTCDCREWVKVLKTLHYRRVSRIAEGKKATASDEKYLRLAEDSLYGELALALDIKRDEVGKYIEERVKLAKA